jgi:hypothetical protein
VLTKWRRSTDIQPSRFTAATVKAPPRDSLQTSHAIAGSDYPVEREYRQRPDSTITRKSSSTQLDRLPAASIPLSSIRDSDRLDTQKHRHRHLSTASRKSSSTKPSRPAVERSESSSKLVCTICSKTTNVKYDPIIACPGCQKHYHDSCRRPPLIEGVDP